MSRCALPRIKTTHTSPARPGAPPFPDMIWIPGRRFLMGSDEHYPEERPAHEVAVDGFWMDRHPVTNEAFRRFVDATGYVTRAETVPDPAEYPGVLAHVFDAHAGSLVFVRPARPVGRDDWGNWWKFVRGANWRHPAGPTSSIARLPRHPVVHMAFEDALTYARWAGKALPTEAEWELAARGGLDGAEFAWGARFAPGGRSMANIWQGEFPWQNLCVDGHEGTSPVGAFPANGYGLFDMIGNVWEWTTDWYAPGHTIDARRACCIPQDACGGDEATSGDASVATIRIPRKVLKGGSYLSAPNSSRRYRPAARFPQPVDASACHIGFRCVARVPPAERG